MTELTFTSSSMLLPSRGDFVFKENQKVNYPDTSGLSSLINKLEECFTNWSKGFFITNSATEGLFASLLLLTNLGAKTIAINEPAYFGLFRQVKELNLNLVTFTNFEDLNSLDFDILLVAPGFNLSNFSVLGEHEANIINELKSKRDFYLIVDAAYNILRTPDEFDDSLNAESKTIRVGSLSKAVSPDGRVGFVSASNDLKTRLKSLLITMRLSTSMVVQSYALWGLGFLEKTKEIVLSRSKYLYDLCKNDGLNVCLCEPFVYVDLSSSGVKVAELVDRCKIEKLQIDSPDHYFYDFDNSVNSKHNFIRLNAASGDNESIMLGFGVLSDCISKLK